MSTKEKIKCKAIASNIKLGKYGEWNEETKDKILEEVKKEYDLTDEMCDYIVELMNENKNHG